MSDEKVHTPELPGVRTLKKDTGTDQADLTAAGIVFSVPEKVVDTPEKVDHHAHGDNAHQTGKHVFDVERAFSGDTVQIGTIVTDRKLDQDKRKNIFVAAFNEWWGGARKKVESRIETFDFLKERETASVASPLVRTNIIQEAAQHAKQAPRDDHSHTVEKVRTFARDAEVKSGKPFVVKPSAPTQGTWGAPKVAEPKPTAPVTPPAPMRDLRETMIAPVIEKRALPTEDHSAQALYLAQKNQGGLKETRTAVELMKQHRNVPPKVAPTEKEPSWSFFSSRPEPVDLRREVADATEYIPYEPKEPREPQEVIPSRRELQGTLREIAQNPLPPQIETKTAPVYVPPPLKPEVPVPPRVVASPTPTPVPQERTSPPPSRAPAPTPTARSSSFLGVPRVLLYGTIMIVGSGLGVVVAVMVFRFLPELTTPSEPEVVMREANYVISDIHMPVLIQDIASVRETLEAERARTGRTYITADLTEEDRTGTTSLMSSDLMRMLGQGAPASFVRSLRGEYALGITYGETPEPFLIFQSTSFDVAFAGMLAWEKTLSDDLSPFFETTGLSSYPFRDALTSNRSIRILRDESGNERIVYAFVNKNVIIITTDTAALSRLLDRMR